jgi:superfamily I DNA/RNA helicase
MATRDHKAERKGDVDKIRESNSPRKIVVAGPGTGKSRLFTELIKKKRAEGKRDFFAITFIGKLGDALADDLCGLATTHTMHGFARSFVLQHTRGWNYYPKIDKIIEEDLAADGIHEFDIGDENYIRKSKHYRAVGDNDVVYYAAEICRKDPKKIPRYDLILIDEYQDFNETESKLVDILATKNEMVVVGDDDQALYAFKGSSPAFIRAKYHDSNDDWASFSLRFCSRCTAVIIGSFHRVVKHFDLNQPNETDIAKKRIEKEYICYLTGKEDGKDADSSTNPAIHLIKNCPPGMIAYKIQSELETIIEVQKIKEVLVIGEGQSCAAILQAISQQLKSYGFKNVDHRGSADSIQLKHEVIDAYRFIGRDSESLLGWRILGNPPASERVRHIENAASLLLLIDGTPSKIAEIKPAAIMQLEREIENWTAPKKKSTASKRRGSVGTAAAPLSREEENEQIRKKVLVQTLRRSTVFLPRPLGNLDITVCNILSSKGLGADVVFLVGFDQGKFPAKTQATESEIYQMLVGMTRAKKRIYLVNTVNCGVSNFIDGFDGATLSIKEVDSH